MPHCWKSHVTAHNNNIYISDNVIPAQHLPDRVHKQGSDTVTRLASICYGTMTNDYRPVLVPRHDAYVCTCFGTEESKKGAKIRNRYNLAPHLTQDTNVKVTTLQLDITNESQEVSPFPAGDHKA